MSEKTGISRSAISRIKNGHVCPDVAQASAIATFFKISVDQLISEKITNFVEELSDEYIPILSIDSNGSISFKGGIEKNEKQKDQEIIAITGGGAVTCSLFDSKTVALVLKKNLPSGGEMCFILVDGRFIVANYFNEIFSYIDNPAKKINNTNAFFVGSIVKIEKTYINSQKVAKRIIDRLGGYDIAVSKYRSMLQLQGQSS